MQAAEMERECEGPPVLDEMLCFDIYATQHALAEVYKPLLRPLGLTYPQYLVLVCLWEQRESNVGTIGRRLDLETSTLTPLLKRMEKGGLVTRRRDRNDERRVLVVPTDRGRALQVHAKHIPRCIAEATGLDADALAALHGRIRSMRAALQDYLEARATPATGD